MKKYTVLFLSIFSYLVHAEEIDCKNAITTYEMNVCAGREMEAADAELDKYLTKAKHKYSEEKRVVDLLVKSQEAWLAYRKVYCDGIYEMWSSGTIRGVMYGSCMVQLTKQRTHKIWEDYLTYMDSTPPLLPEPK
jgi:uncharacterized protein YecT (DUF1311 family)